MHLLLADCHSFTNGNPSQSQSNATDKTGHFRWVLLAFGFLLFYPIFNSPLKAQQRAIRSYEFENMAIEEGTQTFFIEDMEQDSTGFIWHSGASRPIRYDGRNYRGYEIGTGDKSTYFTQIENIIVDRGGRPWFGHDGATLLSYYDYPLDSVLTVSVPWEGKMDLDFNLTYLLEEAPDGSIWFFLRHRDRYDYPILSRYHPEKEEFHFFADSAGQSTLPFDKLPEVRLASNYQYPFTIDHDGTIWLGKQGLAKIAGDTLQQYYTAENSPLRNDEINYLKQTSDSLLLVGTVEGLYSLSANRQTWNLVEGTDSLQVDYLYEDLDGRIWVTAREQTLIWDDDSLSNVTSDKMAEALGAPVLIPKGESEEELWFINKNMFSNVPKAYGVSVLDKQTGTYTPIYNSEEKSKVIGGNRLVTDLLVDRSGSVFLSHIRYGIDHYAPGKKKFHTVFNNEPFTTNGKGMPGLEFRMSPQGHFWRGTYSGYIYIHDPETGNEFVFTEMERATDRGKGPRNRITSFAWEKPGVVYVGSEWSALQRIEYDPETFEIKDTKLWLPFPKSDPNRLGGGIIMCTFFDEKDRLWVGTTSGLSRYRPETDDFQNSFLNPNPEFHPKYVFGRLYAHQGPYTWFWGEPYSGAKRVNRNTGEVELLNYGQESENPVVSVNHLLVTPDEEVFLTRDRGGIFTYSSESGQLEPVNLDMPRGVRNLAAAPDGNLLISTEYDGVFKMSREGEFRFQLTTEDGLPVNSISETRVDKEDRYWIQTSVGISLYDPGTDDIINFGKVEGIEAAENSNGFMMHQTSNGYYVPLWFSLPITYFRPDEFSRSTLKEVPLFSAAQTNRRSLPLQHQGYVEIEADETNYRFSFFLPDYTNPNKHQFRYRIAGFQEDWSDWSFSNEVSLTNLPTGSYTLEIQARDEMHQLAEATLAYPFEVLPPWYLSLFAIFGYIVIGGTGLFIVARNYANYRTQRYNERLKAEQAEELARLDRMKTNFLTNISHELRTPLTLLTGPIEQLIERAEELPDGWKQRLKVAKRNGKRLRQLVEQVLDLARLDSQQMKLSVRETDLNEMLNLAGESFQSMAQRVGTTINYQYETGTGVENLYLDRDKIDKVLANLISNAIKYTKDGEINLSLAENDDLVTVSVSDTGSGIDAERLPHIFDRFHSTGDSIADGESGIGVGLAITREFVELHGGSISVDSVPGEGTTFTITLPKGTSHFNDEVIIIHEDEEDARLGEFKEQENSGDASVEEDNLPPQAGTFPSFAKGDEMPTILVVEDNGDMQRYITDVLADLATVHRAANGLEGKKILSLHQPDLIITDIMMPEMDGFEFAQSVKAMPEHAFTPIIMLTARAETEDRLKGFTIGVQDYMVKPFNPQELKVRAANLLSYQQARKESREDQQEELDLNEDQLLLQKLRSYIRQRLNESITVEALAAEAAMSRRQFYRKIKSLTGFTPAGFIKEIRLQRAMELVQKRKTETLSELSYQVGFSSAGYFKKQFAKRFGQSPDEYM